MTSPVMSTPSTKITELSMRRTWNTTDIQSIVFTIQYSPEKKVTYRLDEINVSDLAMAYIESLVSFPSVHLTPDQKAEVFEKEIAENIRAISKKIPEVKKRARADKYL